MFFILAKILGFFSMPSNVLMSLGIIGVVLTATRRFARAGRRIAVTALILLGVAGWSPFGNAIILPLEERFPAWDGSPDSSRGAPAGIIPLAGALDTVLSPVRGEEALDAPDARLTA